MYKSLHKIYEHIDEMLLCCEVHRWKPMVSVACAHRPLANSSIFSRFHEYLNNLSHPMKRQNLSELGEDYSRERGKISELVLGQRAHFKTDDRFRTL